jgi:Flp pilus assembly protein TadG
MLREIKKIRFRRGISIVSTALVLPLILLLVFALIEYSWMFYKMHLVSNAARVGARIAVLPDSIPGDVQFAIDNLMNNADIGVYSISFYDEAGASIGDLDSVGVGEAIECRVTVTVNEDISIFRFKEANMLPLPDYLVGSVTMSKEGSN